MPSCARQDGGFKAAQKGKFRRGCGACVVRCRFLGQLAREPRCWPANCRPPAGTGSQASHGHLHTCGRNRAGHGATWQELTMSVEEQVDDKSCQAGQTLEYRLVLTTKPRGTWLAWSVECPTLDLGAMGSSPALGIERTEKISA